jgi:ribokinase
MTFDVLGLGAVALDEFLYVDDYPAPDTKVRVLEWHTECGGLTGNALVAAARLGAKCAYAGRLGTSAEARAIEKGFAIEGVDTTYASRQPEDGVVKSTIIVGTASRTRNVFSRRMGLTGANDDQPPDEVLRSTRVLMIDHHGGSGAARAAKIAVAAGIPVVGDFERLDAPFLTELLSLTSHLIVPESFAMEYTARQSAKDAALSLAESGRAATIVTSGPNGCWAVEGGVVVHHPALVIDAIDTSGCGDVFHGAYAAALAEGEPLNGRLRFASAAAALKATRRGIQRAMPYRPEVDAFLDRMESAPPGSANPQRENAL